VAAPLKSELKRIGVFALVLVLSLGVFSTLRRKASVPVTVIVGPPVASVAALRQQVFTATVTGSDNTSVVWSIDSPAEDAMRNYNSLVVGGIGSISSNGVYTAPASVTQRVAVIIRATSKADPTKSSTATVTLEPEPAAPETTSRQLSKHSQPNSIELKRADEARHYGRLAERLLAAGDLRGALKQYTVASELDPGNSDYRDAIRTLRTKLLEQEQAPVGKQPPNSNQ
jgi:hypothetical protein